MESMVVIRTVCCTVAYAACVVLGCPDGRRKLRLWVRLVISVCVSFVEFAFVLTVRTIPPCRCRALMLRKVEVEASA